MRRKKVILRGFLFVLLSGFLYLFWYLWNALPIISGYGAKNLCSAVFLQHRPPADVIREDLGDFPLTLGSFTVNEQDSSVTGSVWGFAKKKAIYRKGLGATLINELSEDAIRAQHLELPALPRENTDTIDWPLGDKTSKVLPANLDQQSIGLAIGHVFNNRFRDKEVYTRAVLVIYKGEIVAEQYAKGFDRHTLMLGWSMSKSFTSAMIGILVDQNKLSVDAPAPVPEWKGNDRGSITLKELLQQTSGLDFREIYSSPSEATNMLFKKGDMAGFTASRPLSHTPGTFFSYSSGNANILSRIIRQTEGEQNYQAFPYQALFYRAGMYSALLEPDASGTYIGSSYSYATARDFARFGLLYFNHGRVGNEQLLSESWVLQTIQPFNADPLRHYGYQFWLNGISNTDSTRRQFPDVPADMFYADGYGGQNIYIIPSRDLVVVRLGLHVIDDNNFLREIIASFRP